MDCTYLIENVANKNIELEELLTNSDTSKVLFIICYHITKDQKYPFLQFMLEKIPFSVFYPETLTLPLLSITDYVENMSVEQLVRVKINKYLKDIGCKVETDNDIVYNGIVNDSLDRNYAIVDISKVDIKYLKLFRESTVWFALSSEIINTMNICNIQIDSEVTNLFQKMPELAILHKPDKLVQYNLPDVVYTGSEYKNAEFNSIFGISKRKIYSKLEEYYYFYRNFHHAVKEGGWCSIGGTNEIDINNKELTHSKGGRLLVDNKYGRFLKGGINRYVVFDPTFYFEDSDELSITDEEVEKFDGNSMMICFMTKKNTTDIKPDVLVKSYEYFHPLSVFMLNKDSLGESYDLRRKTDFMVW